MLLCKLAFGSNMHPHSLARYKFITKILLYVYMQRIQPEGSRHEVGWWTAGSRQARGGAKHKPVVGRCEDKPGVAMWNIG